MINRYLKAASQHLDEFKYINVFQNQQSEKYAYALILILGIIQN
jgi:hypothetical protein